MTGELPVRTEENQTGYPPELQPLLTKRELFAGMICAELAMYYKDEFPQAGAKLCAQSAVLYADELLKELAK